MYLGAYQSGALFLEPQIRLVLEELQSVEGYDKDSLPEITFVQIPAEDKKLVMEMYQKDQEQRVAR